MEEHLFLAKFQEEDRCSHHSCCASDAAAGCCPDSAHSRSYHTCCASDAAAGCCYGRWHSDHNVARHYLHTATAAAAGFTSVGHAVNGTRSDQSGTDHTDRFCSLHRSLCGQVQQMGHFALHQAIVRKLCNKMCNAC